MDAIDLNRELEQVRAMIQSLDDDNRNGDRDGEGDENEDWETTLPAILRQMRADLEEEFARAGLH